MKQDTNTLQTISQVAVLKTSKDMLTAVFITSVLLNAAVFIAWLTISVDPTVSVAFITR